MRECTQKMCDLRGTGRCPRCESCGCPSDIVSDYCEICYCCEREPNFTRGSDKKDKLTENIAIIMTTGEKKNEK